MKNYTILFLFSLSAISAEAAEKVNIEELSTLITHQTFQYPATVIALKDITLSSQIAGNIQSSKNLVGSLVSKNQFLLKIDCTDHVLSRDQAVAALTRLKAQKELSLQQLQRAKQLVRIKSISNQELDQKQTTLDANVASLEEQHIRLKIIDHTIDKCSIKAPFSGVITDKHVNQGSYVTIGSPLVDLSDPTSVELEVTLPINIVNQLPASHNVLFTQNDTTYPLIIRSVLPILDPITKQQRVRLTFLSKEKPLANSIGLIEWQGDQKLIPSQYIVTRNKQLGIFIAKDNKAIFKPLKRAIEGENSPIKISDKTLVIINKLLILKNDNAIETQ